MITSPGRRSHSPRVTRHFEFTRLQEQLIAIAYHALIPVVARPLGRPSSRCDQNQSASVTTHDLRTKAGGA
jgi:hypothetical protein